MVNTQITTEQIKNLESYIQTLIDNGGFSPSIHDHDAEYSLLAHVHEGGSGGSGGSLATRVRRVAAGQTVPHNTSTPMQWDTGDLDLSTSYDPANNTRWVCPADGTYLIMVSLKFTASHGGVFGGDLFKNGAAVKSHLWPGSTVSPVTFQIAHFYELVAGDYFSFNVYQNSNATKTIDIDNTYIAGMRLGGGAAGTPTPFNFIEKNPTPGGVIGTVGNTGEIVVAGMDVLLPALGDTVEIDGEYWWSQNHGQTPKSVKVRLRRDNVAGAELASNQQNATIDSSGGHDRSWIIDYTDSAPTTGRYVITVEPVAGNSTSTIFSDTRTFQAVTTINLLRA